MEQQKADIINSAFSKLRISGLTVSGSPGDIALGLGRLEALMHEYITRNIDVGYDFEPVPDSGAPSGIYPQYTNAVSTCLAENMLSDFGKGMAPDPVLMRNYSAATSYLMSATAFITETTPGSRMPRGGGNTRGWPVYSKFNRHIEQAPNTSTTETMWIGDIDDFQQNFESEMTTAEDIDTYTITADDGLNILSDSVDCAVVSYRVEAVSNHNTDSNRAYQRVKIVATTIDGRRFTRYTNFKVKEAD